MNLKPMGYYCEALDEIAIIPTCVSRNYIERHGGLKERKYISWLRREADIRLYMEWESFVKLTPEAQRTQCEDVIRRSLDVVAERCERKRIAFKKDELLADILAK